MAEFVALDSNALTYLLDAVDETYGLRPDGSPVAGDRLAMIRCFFYAECSFWVPPTVKEEYGRIRDLEKQQKHDRWSMFLLEDVEPQESKATLDRRASDLSQHHRGFDDCRVVAEAESLGIKRLLSCDNDLIRDLNGNCRLTILRPSEFFASLALPPRARPRLVPTSRNPLAYETWWRV